jgi:molybdopterin synthase sulfur carrier subunit
MQIQLRFFASLREALGLSCDTVTVPDCATTAQDVLAVLRERGGSWAAALADAGGFRVAVDQRLGTIDSPVRDGAEVAFFPPVTGG